MEVPAFVTRSYVVGLIRKGAEAKLTALQCLALLALGIPGAEERVTVRELAMITGLPQRKLSTELQALQRVGKVNCEAQYWELTEHGRRVVLELEGRV